MTKTPGPYQIRQGERFIRRINFQIPEEDWEQFVGLHDPGERLSVSLRRVFRAGLDYLREQEDRT